MSGSVTSGIPEATPTVSDAGSVASVVGVALITASEISIDLCEVDLGHRKNCL
jgi:hypothetical protein